MAVRVCGWMEKGEEKIIVVQRLTAESSKKQKQLELKLILKLTIIKVIYCGMKSTPLCICVSARISLSSPK